MEKDRCGRLGLRGGLCGGQSGSQSGGQSGGQSGDRVDRCREDAELAENALSDVRLSDQGSPYEGSPEELTPGEWTRRDRVHQDWIGVSWALEEDEDEEFEMMDSDVEASADLNPEQEAWMDKLEELFPRGFLFCTPANHDRPSRSWEQRCHVLYSLKNLDRMWSCLYDLFEPPQVHAPEDTDADSSE